MTKLQELDNWIGKNLFAPPIIKLCQITRQTQYAVAKQFMIVASLSAFYHAKSMLWMIIWGLISTGVMVYALVRADAPDQSTLLFRALCMAFFLMDVITGAMTNNFTGIEFWLLAAAYEYANTIKTIPPTKIKKTASKLAPSQTR